MNQLLVVHGLPLWFLVFSLFLPRVALALAWLQGVLVPFRVLHGLVPLIDGDCAAAGADPVDDLYRPGLEPVVL